MDKFELTRNYLKARTRILEREANDAALRALDGRATSGSKHDWENIRDFAMQELHIIRDAMAELPKE